MEIGKKLECLFSWDLKKDFTDVEYNDYVDKLLEEDQIPFFALINSIMLTYINTITSKFSEALQNIKKTDHIWKTIDHEELKSEGISIKIVSDIIEKIEMHVLSKSTMCNEIELIMNKSGSIMIKDTSLVDRNRESTLYGCKSAAWSTLHEDGMNNAIDFARKAMCYNDKCTLWKFLLAKNLRRLRRIRSIGSKPGSEELNLFLECYTACKENVTYGIYAGQAYQESNEKIKANVIYQEIQQLDTKNVKIQLRLALRFLRLREMSLAKSCLDHAEVKEQNSSQFLHYKGMYYMHLKQYKEACKYLKKSANPANFGAEILYGSCGKKLDPKNFSLVDHYTYMLNKYRVKEHQQEILILLGMEYQNEKMYESAFECFKKAIELNKNSEKLKKIYNRFTNKPSKISDLVNHTLRFLNNIKYDDLPDLIQELLKDELKNLTKRKCLKE